MEFSCEYQFEDIEIEVDGVRVGCFDGMAELAHDSGYSTFWVKAIVLDGRKQVSRRNSIAPWIKHYEGAKVALPRPMYGREECFGHYLFEAIETALYRDPNAEEFFHEKHAEEMA